MGEILHIHNHSPERSRIASAAEWVRQGQVIAIPTDTFYGLAANPFDSSAVKKIFSIKKRPSNQPLLLLVNSLEMAAELSAESALRILQAGRTFLAGPLDHRRGGFSQGAFCGNGSYREDWPAAAIRSHSRCADRSRRLPAYSDQRQRDGREGMRHRSASQRQFRPPSAPDR